jgi:hypothetical protein
MKTPATRRSRRWFRLWILAGAVTAVLLLANSISNYGVISRRVLIGQVRRDLAQQMAALDARLHASAPARLDSILRDAQQHGDGQIAWIQVFNREGRSIAAVGPVSGPSFTGTDVQSRLRNRRPVFRTLKSAAGEMVVEAFPAWIPGENGNRPEPGMIEIGAPLESAATALWPIRRVLLINIAAGIVMLVSLGIGALHFRSYLAGKKLEEELALARQVQRDLLPGPHQSNREFQISAECLPADGVSGDFYDSFTIEGGRRTFVLGDVAGKGVPAALLMGVLHGAVRSSAWTQSASQHVGATARINRLLCEHASKERFASMFWAYFDPQTGLLHYVNAGHCPPLLFRAGGLDPQRLHQGGPVLGLLPAAKFEQAAVPLEPGDTLVLYSDGIVETLNAAYEQFGEERLIAAAEHAIRYSAPEIRNRILGELGTFAGSAEAEDDRTLVVIRYLGRRPETAEPEPSEDLAVQAA